jgi:hypothetical protein
VKLTLRHLRQIISEEVRRSSSLQHLDRILDSLVANPETWENVNQLGDILLQLRDEGISAGEITGLIDSKSLEPEEKEEYLELVRSTFQ